MATKKAKQKRVTDLFMEGKILVLPEDEDGPVTLWVNKLNPFEKAEAENDGHVAKSKRLLTIGPNDDEMTVLRANIQERTVDELVGYILRAHGNEFYVKALDDIRADEAWRDDLELLRRSDELADDGMPISEAEAKKLAELNTRYMAELNRLTQQHAQEKDDELRALDRPELGDRYITAYKDQAAIQSYLEEHRVTEIFFSLRDCNAVMDENGRWQHKACDHRERFLDERGEARGLPEQLLLMARKALTDLNMSPREAGNSAAPTGSSASLEQQSAEAASTPSTPAGK